MDIRAYNKEAWDRQVANGNPCTVPVSHDVIEAARRGEWSVILTDARPVPASWFPPLAGLDVLGLACGGGQQCPIFAAAGAQVTVLDNSPAQLSRDREVADREGLALRTVEGDMADLSAFADESFDLVFHPVSNVLRQRAAGLLRGSPRAAPRRHPHGRLYEPGRLHLRPRRDRPPGRLEVKYPCPTTTPSTCRPANLPRMMERAGRLSTATRWKTRSVGSAMLGWSSPPSTRTASCPGRDIPSRYMPCFYATRAVRR